MTIKEAIFQLENRLNVVYFTDKDMEALNIAIKLLKEQIDPRNDPHYDECDYCKHWECSPDEYPCCECSHAVDFLSKWERIE